MRGLATAHRGTVSGWGTVMWDKVGSWIRDSVEEIFLVLTAIVAIFFLISSHIGLNVFKEYTNDVIVTLLCLIAICLFFEGVDVKKNARALDAKVGALQSDLDQKFAKVCGDLDIQVGKRHEHLLTRVIESLDGFEYRRFRDATEFVNYLADRISQAKRSVDDLTWVSDSPAERGPQERAEADKRYYSATASASTRIAYREIYIFCDDSKYDKIKGLVSMNPPYYHCRYYADSVIPRPVFMIIDKEEVLLYGAASDGIYCAVRHAHLVESFVDYFQALWERATKLKEGKKIYPEYRKIMEGH
jgi:hypothetical protein